jgi:hypothetical protein
MPKFAAAGLGSSKLSRGFSDNDSVLDGAGTTGGVGSKFQFAV